MLALHFRQVFAVVTLERPGVLNALNRAMLEQLDSMLTEIEKSAARCVIFTGAGDRAFCAGADITEIVKEAATESYTRTLFGQGLFSRLDGLKQTSIALVNGVALGGGCELALACTFRVATAAAQFGLPEVKLGLVPGYGGTQRLTRLLGLPRALEIMLTGEPVGAEEAFRIGLVSRVWGNEGSALDQTISFAAPLTRWSLAAQRSIRESATRGRDQSLAEGLRIEAHLSALSLQSSDGREGLRAFLEKRQPKFG